MELAISHYTWRVLRTILRADPLPVRGLDLRLVRGRKTKDGSFLAALVAAGLIERAPDKWFPRKAGDHYEASMPDVFFHGYTLTEKGEYAAEHGLANFTTEERQNARKASPAYAI